MDAVILDVGGVLLVPHAAVVTQVLEPYGVRLDAQAAERAHYVGVQALDAAKNDLSGRQAYLEGYMDAAGVPPAAREQALMVMVALWGGSTIDLWRQRVRGSIDGLRRLARTGRKLGIVSNADGTIAEQLLRNEICQIGEGLGVPVLAIVDSHVVGVAKPAAEIFRHVLDPLGVAADRALYVGDTVRYDVSGARAAGLHPIHFDPYGLCRYQSDHPHVKSLGEVESVLD